MIWQNPALIQKGKIHHLGIFFPLVWLQQRINNYPQPNLKMILGQKPLESTLTTIQKNP